jgi:hypothetical protein
MDSFKSQTLSPDIDSIERRPSLYYNKYTYRARFHLLGLNRTYYVNSIEEYIRRITSMEKERSLWGIYNDAVVKKTELDLANINLNSIENFINWRNIYTKKENKQAMLRLEGNTAGIFSNDLDLLKTLKNIQPNLNICYTTVDIDLTLDTSVKYFLQEPKFKYRVYFKSKRISDDTKKQLDSFVKRYESTGTTILPCPALQNWLNGNTPQWRSNYLSSAYHLNYNDESSGSLIALMFPGLIHKFYKLEKHPNK